MSLPAEHRTISVADYLAGEQQSQVRHEYLDGEVRAMAGADEAHNRISLNLAFHLRAATRSQSCAVFIKDMKVRVEAEDRFYYPDVLLTCEPSDPESLFKAAPCLIAEVLCSLPRTGSGLKSTGAPRTAAGATRSMSRVS